jgi:hypothetical protein
MSWRNLLASIFGDFCGGSNCPGVMPTIPAKKADAREFQDCYCARIGLCWAPSSRMIDRISPTIRNEPVTRIQPRPRAKTAMAHRELRRPATRTDTLVLSGGDTVPEGMIEPILSKLAPSPGNGSVSHSAGSSRCQSWFTVDSSSRTARCKTKVRIASTTSSIISAVVRRFNMAIRAISLP